MTDDDRAAKAARAKALLKKRQQQKRAGPGIADAGQSTPGSPISRAMSPALPQVHDSRVSANEGNVLAGFSSPHAPFADQLFGSSSQSDTIVAPAANGSSQLDFDKIISKEPKQLEEDHSQLIQDQRQTISLLVSEKNSLTENIERYRDIEAQLSSKDEELENCKLSLAQLDARLAQLNEERTKYLRELQERDSESTSLKARLRDEDRELQLLRTEASGLRDQLERQERRSRELEEQIQNDDRVERLEAKLQNTTDRAEELEFQLSKTRQSLSRLKEERDNFETSLREKAAETQDWQDKHAAVKSSQDVLQQSLAALESERDALLSSVATLKSELESTQSSRLDTATQLDRVAEELLVSTRLVETAQDELCQALSRADNAEKIQRDLQEEGTSLMRSLDEMRPKIVELTGTKLDLTEQVDRLSKEVAERDSKIADLENDNEELRVGRADDSRKYDELKNKWNKERESSARALEEIRLAYSELQSQLEDATANAMEIDADRSKQRHLNIRLQEEIDLIRSSQQAELDEITDLQSHLDEQERVLGDERRLREESRAEIEVLRAEISAKEDEIARLRQAQSTSRASPTVAPSTLEDEVMNSLKQRHELELSAAKSQIRSLETSVFDAESTCRALQKQITELKDELQHLRASSGHHGSPSLTKAHIARRFRQTDDMHRTSLSTVNDSPPVFYSAIDESLPPAIRHQRQMSLGMLQARMYSESEAVMYNVRSEDEVLRENDTGRSHETRLSLDHLRRSQFLDENHVFWCASCKGDLIVL